MYARVDAPCWQYAELHEIFHNLGAVQRDAPHPSAAWHCTDEADVMCYDDDASGPVVMTAVCPPEHEALLDCGDNDYFNTNPPAGNYLASHWNTANSSFLQNDDRPPAGPAQPDRRRHHHLRRPGHPSQPPHRRADHHRHRGRAGQPVRHAAPARRRPGRRHRHHRRRRRRQLHPDPGGHHHLPGQLPRLRHPRHRRQPPGDHHRPPRVSARPQASTVTYGQTITVTGTVAPNHRGQQVYLQRLVSGAWKGVATATLTSTSAYTLRAKAPARGTFTYRVVKRADTDHTSATSPTLTVTVR